MKLRKYIVLLLFCFIQAVYANTIFNVTYTAYNYKMTSVQFNQFLTENKFNNQISTSKNNKYVIYKNTIQATALYSINKNIKQEFTERNKGSTIIDSGSSRCEINKTPCQFGSTLSNGVGNGTPFTGVGNVAYATPSNVVGTATPSNVVGTATPSNVVGTATPSNVVGTATPSNVVGTGTPSNGVGTATPSNGVGNVAYATPSNGVETSNFIEIKPLYSNTKKMDYAKISGLYKNSHDKFVLSFTTSLDDIKNHNYIIISQLLKNEFLYGQVILVSFSVYQ